MGRKYGDLRGATVTLSIDVAGDGGYRNYQNIRFEVDEDFQKLNSYIPGVHCKRPGKCRIRALMDSAGFLSRG